MRAPRYVVTGAPNAGKSTWVRARAVDGDLVWDFDVLASALSLGGRERPRGEDGSRGPWPWPTMKAMLVMRDAFVAWLASEGLSSSAVFVIVRDAVDARVIADKIGAEVVTVTRESWGGCTL